MITAFADELTRASVELRDHLESQAALVAPEPSGQNVLNQIKATLRIGHDWLQAKEKSPRRKEFTKFQEKQPITPAEGRKAMKLYEQFGNWEQEKLLIINGAVSLITLCNPKFAAVVQQFREAANLTKEFVKNLVKEVRDATKVGRRKKQQIESGSGWRQDPSGGGRHYQLPPMYNEEAGMKVEALAEERGVRAITVVEEAVIAYAEQPTVAELKCQHQEEMQAAVTEMRDEHIRMQREIIELKQMVQVPVIAPEIYSFSTWVEFADSVEYDRTTLLNTVKPWSQTSRQSLSVLLADHLSENQNNLNQVTWVPEKLLHSALSKLFFTVSRISGPDNLLDEPEIEEIYGCRFVSVKHLGTQRREQWIFETQDGKTLSVFGKEFVIEGF